MNLVSLKSPRSFSNDSRLKIQVKSTTFGPAVTKFYTPFCLTSPKGGRIGTVTASLRQNSQQTKTRYPKPLNKHGQERRGAGNPSNDALPAHRVYRY